MKILGLILFVLIVLLQYSLWQGKGSWNRVWETSQKVASQKEANQKNEIRNGVLEAEVQDLKKGLVAIEERARSELGMIKQDEIFFQVEIKKQKILPPDKAE
jgi:cell division protein FtsB